MLLSVKAIKVTIKMAKQQECLAMIYQVICLCFTLLRVKYNRLVLRQVHHSLVDR